MWCPDGIVLGIVVVVVVVAAAVVVVVAATVAEASVVLLWRPGRRSPVNVLLSDD